MAQTERTETRGTSDEPQGNAQTTTPLAYHNDPLGEASAMRTARFMGATTPGQDLSRGKQLSSHDQKREITVRVPTLFRDALVLALALVFAYFEGVFEHFSQVPQNQDVWWPAIGNAAFGVFSLLCFQIIIFSLGLKIASAMRVSCIIIDVASSVAGRAASIVEANISADELRLQGGELTPQEVRTVQAFLRARAAKIRAMKEAAR